MKKFYLLISVLSALLVIGSRGYSQVYTATHTGNWSAASTWDINGIPASTCNNCTITINANVAVRLDVSILLNGASTLKIGSDASSPASLIIPQSGATSFAAGYNVLLDGSNTSNKIVLANANTSVVAITLGEFDGIFSRLLPSTVSIKMVGSAPSLFFGDTPIGNDAPVHGGLLTGPATLNSQNVLPILLGDFEAVLDKKSVNLSWTTLLEINSDHYSIERSFDATHWQPIGKVSAVGNSESKQNYSFVDVSPSSNANYYRLQMVDRDGKYKYSPVKVVRGSLIDGYSVFPNPTREYLNITLSSKAPEQVTVRLINLTGQTLQEQKYTHAAGTTVTLPVSNYPQGSYILSIVGSDGQKETNKVVIAR